MMKSSVELIMSIESSFRNMYRRLFSIETGNDFWKKVICEVTIMEIKGTMNDKGLVLSDVDERVYTSEIECLEGYLKKYSSSVPSMVDKEWVQNKFDDMMGQEIIQGSPRKDALMFNLMCSFNQFMNMTPKEYCTDSDGFFKMIDEMGISRYVHDIEGRYFLIEKIEEEIDKIQSK